MTLPTEGQAGHLQKHADIDTLIAGHTSQIAAGDVTNPASAAGVALSATFATFDGALSLRPVKNLLPQPSPTVVAGWFSQGFGTAGAGTTAIALKDGHEGRNAFIQTWTTAPTDSGVNTGPILGTRLGDPGYYAVVGGILPVVASVYMEARGTTDYVQAQLQVAWFDAGNVQTGTHTLNPVAYIRQGRRQRLVAVPIVPPVGTVRASILVRLWTASQVGTGSILLSAPQIEESFAPGPYRDGDHGDASWSGTPNLSPTLAAVGVTKRYAAYGDSHFGQQDGGGFFLPQHLADILGRDVFLGGRGGETITGIGIRQGGVVANVTITGGTIPTSGSVAATVTTTPAGNFRDELAWPFVGQVAGVDGILTRAVGGAWSFARSYSGSTVAAAAGIPFAPYHAADSVDAVIIDAGNNLPDAAIVASNMAAIVARCVAKNQDYLILSLYNNATEGTGTAGYNTVTGINAALSAAYPQHYLPVRSWLVANGPAAAGITPTAGDTTARTEDRIPPSLMFDAVHLNDTGRRMVAALIGQALFKRGKLA